MTDLRNALKRASETGGNEALDHGAVSQKVQRVVRRRRAMYAAGTGLFVLVVGFSAFQISEGNWFNDPTVQEAASTPEGVADDIRLRLEPTSPTENDEVVVTMENMTEIDLTYGGMYKLEKSVGGEWQEVTDTGFYAGPAYALKPGEIVVAADLGPLEPGSYRVTKEVGVATYQISFRVAPAGREPDPIEVDPLPDGPLTSPITVSGVANVSEGSIRIEVWDEFGGVLAERVVGLSCADCPAEFSEEFTFDVPSKQSGWIIVSAGPGESNESTYKLEVRVRLAPATEETPSEGDLPAITVDSHQSGDLMTAPSTVVSGTANTFEANVRIRLLDENGDILVDTFTTATCGTGCRGDYSKKIKFQVDHQQSGTLQVFESSAEDGSDINMVEIPVVLAPN